MNGTVNNSTFNQFSRFEILSITSGYVCLLMPVSDTMHSRCALFTLTCRMIIYRHPTYYHMQNNICVCVLSNFMQDNYLNIQRNYFNMDYIHSGVRFIYVNMQDTNIMVCLMFFVPPDKCSFI